MAHQDTPSPVRLELSRTKGFSLAEESRRANGLPAAVVTRVTKWGNPYVVGRDGTRAECVDRYETLVEAAIRSLDYTAPTRAEQAVVEAVRRDWHELAGHNLACFCRGAPCHADPLINAIRKQELRHASRPTR